MSRRREPPPIRFKIQTEGIRCAAAHCVRRADYFQRVGTGGFYWCRGHVPAHVKAKKEVK